MLEPGFWARLVVAVLATWRLTHLLVKEDGPADLIVRLRKKLARSWAGRLMDCFHCVSVWIAAPFAFFVCRDLLDRFVVWLALSGAACLLERTEREPVLIQRLDDPMKEE